MGVTCTRTGKFHSIFSIDCGRRNTVGCTLGDLKKFSSALATQNMEENYVHQILRILQHNCASSTYAQNVKFQWRQIDG